MRLYIVRHGQTDWNKLSKMQGKIDVPINEIGKNQAQNLKDKLSSINFDICFCSPLKRTLETASIIVNNKCKIVTDARLTERGLGDLEGKDYSLYDRLNFWNYDKNSGDYGVEKIKDLFARINNFLDYLKENYKDKTILVVSHHASIRALNFIIKGYGNNTDFLSFDVKQGAVFTYFL